MSNEMTTTEFKQELITKLSHMFGVSAEEATNEQYYKAIASICNEKLANGYYQYAHDVHKKTEVKTVYYLCMEFLMGRSLKNNLYNLNLTDTVDSVLADMGIKLDKLYECEPDAGLGNGGLGRLAACYLDGLANDGYNGMGYGLLYEYGIFKQKIIDGWQTELPDFWLPGGDVWLTENQEDALEISFGGHVESDWQDGYYTSRVVDATTVIAIPNDMYIPGKDDTGYSVLRLWKAKAPGFDMSLFNQGDYIRAVEKQAMAEAICKVLYPADNHPEGKSLRLRQQYFLVSASIQDMIKRHLRHHKTVDSIPEKMAIHINDTHPTLGIPELMRILLDECGYGWDEAWKICTQTFAYTNHTVMKEALECWSEDLVKRLLPRIYEIIKEIDNRYRAYIWDVTHDAGRVENMAIVSNGIVRMANLCVATCHSVNGVSALHSEILKQTIFSDYYALTPGKFKNVTNGIAHRRWLCQANPELTAYLTELIGDGFVHNAAELEKLKAYADDETVLRKFAEIKLHNKERFAAYIKEKQGFDIDPNTIFDVQVKRLHEYKRQHLNVYEIISNYLMLKQNPNMDFAPRTYIFGAKAASGYYMAKKIISLICNLSELINNDPEVNDKMKVIYIEDYNVSMAEMLMPAADISEQISLAGTEASGTGNMKFMINGAVTLGTMDGANVEIYDAVGKDNIFIFGMSSDEMARLQPQYAPGSYYANNNDLHQIIDFINGGINGNYFPELGYNMINNDPYMVLADYADYHKTRQELYKAYEDTTAWARKSLLNVAGSGIFAADRSVQDYANDIWHCKPVSQCK